ncbi:phosphoesterase [Myxozyma melibiosi]|uniref:Phosphoesterase n=1 Tax=Myxozyma melibiosi TaxID=54550 RepID=A0ABR1F8K7_9ASCO
MASRVLALIRRMLRSRVILILLLTSLVLLFGSLRSLPQIVSTTVNLQDNLPDILVRDVAVRVCPRLLSRSCTMDGYRKISKDLRLGSSWLGQAYLFVSEVPRSEISPDAQVVLDVHIGSESPAPVGPGHDKEPPQKLEFDNRKSYHEPLVARSEMDQRGSFEVEEGETTVDNKGKWIRKSHNMWLKIGRPTDFAVTDVDVLFGIDAVDPRFGWSLKGDRNNSLAVGSDAHPRVTIKLGQNQEVPSVRLRVDSNGKFKIIQVADLHFSTGVGKCLDPYPEDTAENCEADTRTLAFLNHLLDEEKPDFAVLTGDQIFGDAAPDAKTALLKSVAPFIHRQIPFAMTFGNHDDEADLSREQLMDIASHLPFSMSQAGPEFAKGVGNYQQTVYMHKKDNPVVSIYFLDTHKYSPNPKKLPGYDWIDESQLEYLKATYQQFSPLRSLDVKKHLSMAFFHIPLTEYRNTSNPIVGNYREPSTAPRHNTGARSLLSELGVSVVSVGHDHVNDFCMFDRSYQPSGMWDAGQDTEVSDAKNVPQKTASRTSPIGEGEHPIWLCHGGGAGLGGYGGYGGYVRRMRFFEIDVNTNMISTWKRLENGNTESRIDQQVLVDGGTILGL